MFTLNFAINSQRFFGAQNQELNDPVMGGKSTGTWHVDAAKFVGIFDGEVHKRWATGEGFSKWGSTVTPQ